MDYFNYHPGPDTNRGVETPSDGNSEPLTETQIQILMYVDALTSMVSMFNRMDVYSWVSSLGPGAFPAKIEDIPDDVCNIIGASPDGFEKYLRWLDDERQNALANQFGEEEFDSAIAEMMGDD